MGAAKRRAPAALDRWMSRGSAGEGGKRPDGVRRERERLGAPGWPQIHKEELPVRNRAIRLVIASPDGVPRQRSVTAEAARRAWRGNLYMTQTDSKGRRRNHTLMHRDGAQGTSGQQQTEYKAQTQDDGPASMAVLSAKGVISFRHHTPVYQS